MQVLIFFRVDYFTSFIIKNVIGEDSPKATILVPEGFKIDIIANVERAKLPFTDVKRRGLMPCFRQTSFVATPASCSWRMPAIRTSLKWEFFIEFLEDRKPQKSPALLDFISVYASRRAAHSASATLQRKAGILPSRRMHLS